MTLCSIIIALLLACPTFFCISMDLCITIEKSFDKLFPKDKFVNFDTKRDKQINGWFKSRWGYNIPNILIEETDGAKSTHKVVSSAHLNNNKKIKILDTFNTSTTHMQINIQESSSFYTIEELKEKIKVKEDDLDKLHQKNEYLKQQIMRLHTSPIIVKPIVHNSLQKKSLNKSNSHNQISFQNIIFHRAMTSDQKRKALLSLMNDYQVKKSARYLMLKMKNECLSNDTVSVHGCLDQNISWKYNHEKNKLVFDISSSDSEDSSSD